MNQVMTTLMGAGICCVAPLLAFGVGVYYARYGLPFSMRWRGIARREVEDEE